jgi:peptidyl-prolyl cis-trans isomerase SurA
MSARWLAAALLALSLGGCALPGWVPFVGKKKSEPAEARPAAPVPPAKPAPTRAAETEDVADRVVAVVNNDAITLGELQENIAIYRQENRGRVSASDEDLQKQFLGRLIDTRLQIQEAGREKITVDEVELNEELAERMKRFGTKTTEELEALVKAQGLSYDTVKKRIRDALLIQKVMRRKVSLRVSVTEPEIDRYIADNREKLEAGLSYHARHILIVPDDTTDAGWEAARIRADVIRTQIKEGADFSELARQNSKDASAKDGGDLGVLKRGELALEIESRILALKPGELSSPFRSPLGWHLFRLESKDSLEGDGLLRVRQQVKDILYREKYEARMEAWIKEMKDRAIIEVRM